MNNLDFNYFCTSCPQSKTYREKHCFTRYKIFRFKKGEVIAYRGLPITYLLLLRRGKINISIVLDYGISYLSLKKEAPNPIAPLALFSLQPKFPADIIAVEDSVLIGINKDTLEEHLMKCKIFLRNYLMYHSTVIDMFTTHLSVLSHKSIKGKLAYYLLSIAENRMYVLDRNIEKLADYFYVERPSLSRAISQLVQDKVITYRKGKGELLDIDYLRNLIV